MAAALNASDWLGLDQRAVFPPALQGPLADMQFKLLGPCASDPLVVHQYAAISSSPPDYYNYYRHYRNTDRHDNSADGTNAIAPDAGSGGNADADRGSSSGANADQGDPAAAWQDVSFPDIRPGSCLNGWTMGNLAATPVSMAGALYHLLGKHPTTPLLTDDSLAQMMQFQPVGWVGLGWAGLPWAVCACVYERARASEPVCVCVREWV